MKSMQEEENTNLELKTSQEEAESTLPNEQPTTAFSSQDFARMQAVVNEVKELNEELEVELESERSTTAFSRQDFARMQSVVDEVKELSEESEVELSPEPEEVVTVKSLHQKAWPKATVVGACLFLIFGILASMIGGTLNTVNSPPSKTKSAPEAAIATEEESEMGELKTKNFLTSQSQELSSLNKRRVKPKLKPIQSPAPTYSRPVERIVEVNRPAPPAPVFTPKPTPKPIPVASSPLPQQAPSTANTPDPSEQWKLIANAGRLGGTSPISSSQPTESSASNSTASSSNLQVATRVPETRARSTLSSNTNRDDLPTAPSRQTQSRNDLRLLVVGTKAAGKLETPIAWSGSLKKSNRKFILHLKDPLKAADNSTIIPKGAKLIAQISRADEAGLVQMTAVSVMLDRINEKPLPEDAILILGKKGQPLQARITNINNVGKDMNVALLKGVAKAADLVNQATSESTFSSKGEGFIRTSSTNRRRNYPASFLNGLTESMSEQTQSRTQQAISNMQSQPRVFALNQGTEIQIFVNQSFSF